MNYQQNKIAAIGLATGAIFGVAGSNVSDPNVISALYGISSLGIIIAAVILTIKFLKSGDNYMAIGFLLFAIAEASMNVGTAAGEVGGQSAFGAGMGLYVPSMIFIGLASYFPTWVKYLGMLTTVPFAIAAATIYLGGTLTPSSPIIGIAYALLVLTFIGWIITLVKEVRVSTTSKAIA